MPAMDWEVMRSLFPVALTIALLGAIESLLSATVADGVTGDRHDSNTELMAQGAANLLTPLFGGIPATGAIARSMTSRRMCGIMAGPPKAVRPMRKNAANRWARETRCPLTGVPPAP